MDDVQMSCYGMTLEDIEKQYINSPTAFLSGLEIVVASILSDCQEELCMSNPRVHRQLNIAKYILFKMMEKEAV